MEWNETDMIGRWISFIYRYNQIFMDQQLKTYCIGSGQFIYLLILYCQDGITPQRLASILNIDKGTTTVALKKLLDEGYIRRETDQNDKRSYKVYLTSKARKIQESFKGILSLWTELLTAGFTDAERIQASSYLQRMNDNAVNILRKERGEIVGSPS